MEKKYFGKTEDGREFYLYEFVNKKGSVLRVTDLGAIWQSMCLLDKNGNMKDVVLGYDSPKEYLYNTYFLGATIGRCTNRIERGLFEIDGVKYQLCPNNYENNLHSGPDYYHSRKWQVSAATNNSITFSLFSPDKDQGFPGNFNVNVTYSLDDDNTVTIHYEGVADKNTLVNMTNHSYFNLAGHEKGNILNQELFINAEEFTPVRDNRAIPSGKIEKVLGSVMDFTKGRLIGKDIDSDFTQLKFTGGYDHNFILLPDVKKSAKAYCKESGIAMELFTDAKGLQFYAGNFLKEHRGKNGAIYGKRQGFCLEPQYYPNAINQKNFPSPLLEAGKKYEQKTSYHFYIAE